ncbi:MAG: hypothetical protein K1X89_20520 [Myxococcaceae bacterium]|nr:hypothetical protein [Myxococcaceae bacterium]
MSLLLSYRQVAARTSAEVGGKAHATARLHGAGLRVPDGRVIPPRALELCLEGGGSFPSALRTGLETFARRGGLFAVRSSVVGEDAEAESLAGRFLTLLALPGELEDAVQRCWLAALEALEASGEPSRQDAASRIGLLVQRVAAGTRSGVCFTRSPTHPDAGLIVASFGSCHAVVEGRFDADQYLVRTSRGALRVEASIAEKRELTALGVPDGFLPGQPWRSPWGPTSLHLPLGPHLASARVPEHLRRRPTLDGRALESVWKAALRAADVLGTAADLEWTLAGEQVVVLQARPITTAPAASPLPAGASHTVASPGVARGRVRVVHAPDDAPRFRAGEVLVVRSTTPAFLPMLERAAAVVSEEGSPLSHTAIVARELGIPCLVGVKGATTGLLPDGALVTVDADRGELHTGAPRVARQARAPRDPVVRDAAHLRPDSRRIAASAVLGHALDLEPSLPLTPTRAREALGLLSGRRALAVVWDLGDDQLPRAQQTFDAAAIRRALER